MNGINTKDLCKQLRSDGKHRAVIWTRETDAHFISNRHFAVRFTELPRDVMITLFSIFCRLAEPGETLVSQYGSVVEGNKPVDFRKVFVPEKADMIGSVTPYIRDFGNKIFTSVVKLPNRVAYVDEKYIKLANDTDVVKSTDSPFAPMYLADDSLMVLPYRTTDDPGFIKELIESDQPA